MYQADQALYSDVQAVIDSEAFFRDGNAYFIGVWGQADATQQAVLRRLAPLPDGLPAAQLAQQMPAADLPAALASLRQHDVLHEQDGRWCFTVELMRRWVQTYQPKVLG